MFLAHYYQLFPSPAPTDPIPTTIYCDSESVIKSAKNHIAASTIFPNRTIADDYDVYNMIANTATQLTAFSLNFCHVKGHQDRNPRRRPLSLPELLNIDCDKRAAALLPYTRQHPHFVHPQLPHALPHIVVHGHMAVRNLPGLLRHAATTPAYCTYLQNKY